MDDSAGTDLRDAYSPAPTRATYWFLLVSLLFGVSFPVAFPVPVS